MGNERQRVLPFCWLSSWSAATMIDVKRLPHLGQELQLGRRAIWTSWIQLFDSRYYVRWADERNARGAFLHLEPEFVSECSICAELFCQLVCCDPAKQGIVCFASLLTDPFFVFASALNPGPEESREGGQKRAPDDREDGDCQVQKTTAVARFLRRTRGGHQRNERSQHEVNVPCTLMRMTNWLRWSRLWKQMGTMSERTMTNRALMEGISEKGRLCRPLRTPMERETAASVVSRSSEGP